MQLLAAILLLLAQGSSTHSAEAIQRELNGYATTVTSWASDAALVDRLRQLAAAAGFGESFVMTTRAALVRGWKGATFIDRLRYDESAKEDLAQISLPVMDQGHAIGAITAGFGL